MDTPEVLAWRDGHIEALDQTALPHQVRTLRITTVDQLVEAISTLAVRGAPVLGAAGALGVALAVVAASATASEQISRRGADWLRQTCGSGRLRIHTHCNTGSLACLGWGT